MKHISELKPDGTKPAFDLKGIPTHVCVCGCKIFNLKVIFEDNEISMYFLDMTCASCGSEATAPTPKDLNE
jgi:hypothetical protein